MGVSDDTNNSLLSNSRFGKSSSYYFIHQSASFRRSLSLWKNSEGWLNTNRIHFYHQQADGTRLEIKHRWTTSFKDTPENRAEKKLTIFGGTTGGFSRTNNSCPKIHRSFYIGIKQDVLNGTNHFRMAQAVQNKTIECQLNP